MKLHSKKNILLHHIKRNADRWTKKEDRNEYYDVFRNNIGKNLTLFLNESTMNEITKIYPTITYKDLASLRDNGDEILNKFINVVPYIGKNEHQKLQAHKVKVMAEGGRVFAQTEKGEEAEIPTNMMDRSIESFCGTINKILEKPVNIQALAEGKFKHKVFQRPTILVYEYLREKGDIKDDAPSSAYIDSSDVKRMLDNPKYQLVGNGIAIKINADLNSAINGLHTAIDNYYNNNNNNKGDIIEAIKTWAKGRFKYTGAFEDLQQLGIIDVDEIKGNALSEEEQVDRRYLLEKLINTILNTLASTNDKIASDKDGYYDLAQAIALSIINNVDQKYIDELKHKQALKIEDTIDMDNPDDVNNPHSEASKAVYEVKKTLQPIIDAIIEDEEIEFSYDPDYKSVFANAEKLGEYLQLKEGDIVSQQDALKSSQQYLADMYDKIIKAANKIPFAKGILEEQYNYLLYVHVLKALDENGGRYNANADTIREVYTQIYKQINNYNHKGNKIPSVEDMETKVEKVQEALFKCFEKQFNKQDLPIKKKYDDALDRYQYAYNEYQRLLKFQNATSIINESIEKINEYAPIIPELTDLVGLISKSLRRIDEKFDRLEVLPPDKIIPSPEALEATDIDATTIEARDAIYIAKNNEDKYEKKAQKLTLSDGQSREVVPVHSIGGALSRCKRTLEYMRTNPPDLSQLNPEWEIAVTGEKGNANLADASNSGAKWKEILQKGFAKIKNKENLDNIKAAEQKLIDDLKAHKAPKVDTLLQGFAASYAKELNTWQTNLIKPDGFVKGEPAHHSGQNKSENHGWQHMYNILGAIAWVNAQGEVLCVTQANDLDAVKESRMNGKMDYDSPKEDEKKQFLDIIRGAMENEIKNIMGDKVPLKNNQAVDLEAVFGFPKKGKEDIVYDFDPLSNGEIAQVCNRIYDVVPFRIGVGDTSVLDNALSTNQYNKDIKLDSKIKTSENFRKWESKIQTWMNVCNNIEKTIRQYVRQYQEHELEKDSSNKAHQLHVTGNEVEYFGELMLSNNTLKEWYNRIIPFVKGTATGASLTNFDGAKVSTNGSTYGSKLYHMLTTPDTAQQNPKDNMETIDNLTAQLTPDAIDKMCQKLFGIKTTASKNKRRLIRQ